MIRKVLLYPLLLTACPYTQIEFWRNVFEDLAYGFPPSNTYIVNKYLCCNKVGSEFSYKLDQDISSDEMYEELYSLLNKPLILTENDNKVIMINNYQNTMDMKVQMNIRKKNIKDMMIEKYIINVHEKYNLSYKQSKNILIFITIAMLFKTITNTDIQYTNTSILSIDGLEFKTGNVKFTKKIYSTDNIILHQSPESKYMKSNWDKYIFNLKKNIIS